MIYLIIMGVIRLRYSRHQSLNKEGKKLNQSRIHSSVMYVWYYHYARPSSLIRFVMKSIPKGKRERERERKRGREREREREMWKILANNRQLIKHACVNATKIMVSARVQSDLI